MASHDYNDRSFSSKKQLQIRMLNYNWEAGDSMSGFTVMMEDITVHY